VWNTKRQIPRRIQRNRFDPVSCKKGESTKIEECVSHLKCRLYNKLKTGDYTIFVGEVIVAYANKSVLREKMFFILAKTDFPLWHARSLKSDVKVPMSKQCKSKSKLK
jgi:flavin reductase (DIM6/NTAB) family NADH-FMN oxidoreductase RutF